MMRKYLFFKMPKTGSTFLGRYLKDKHKDLIAIRRHNYLYKDGKKYLPGLGESYEFKFCFVREPVSRFISSYQWIVERQETQLNSYDLTARKAILRYQNFEDFCLNLEKFTSDANNCPIHFYPQYSWITDKQGNLTMDYVGKFESMNDDWKIICNNINIEYEPIYNQNKDSWKSKLSSIRKLLNKSVFTSFTLNQETSDLIKKFYEKDYEIFGY